MKNLLLAIIMMIGTGAGLQAQKFGHMNSQLLLVEMPEVKSADSQLETYQKQLLAKGEQMVQSFQTKYQAYEQEAQSGKLSPLQMQTKESELQKELEAIQAYEQDVQNKLATKRAELYQPLLDRVKAVIDKIGKENGYTMIFDTSVAGTIVFAEETEDVTAMVKAQLGM